VYRERTKDLNVTHRSIYLRIVEKPSRNVQKIYHTYPYIHTHIIKIYHCVENLNLTHQTLYPRILNIFRKVQKISHLFVYTHIYDIGVQGGEESWDALSCRSFSTKEPLNIGHFCEK